MLFSYISFTEVAHPRLGLSKHLVSKVPSPDALSQNKGLHATRPNKKGTDSMISLF